MFVYVLFLWQFRRMADYDNPEFLLWDSIRFALQQARYHQPKTHDCTARDAYFGRVADDVMVEIKKSGWEIAPLSLLKKPYVPRAESIEDASDGCGRCEAPRGKAARWWTLHRPSPP